MGFRERYLNRAMQLEFAPIAVFFLVNWLWGLMAATAAVMAATVLCVALGWRLERRIPVFGIVTVALVVVMGGLTLVFDDADFIKVKPTVGKLLFALALLVGMHLRPSMLERALGTMVFLSARGWRVLQGAARARLERVSTGVASRHALCRRLASCTPCIMLCSPCRTAWWAQNAACGTISG